MAIANGRNNMLASIEDSASMLNNLVDELDRFYSNKLTDFERKIDLLRIENKNEEPKVLCSMCSDWNYAISIYDELFTETKEMLICKVYSYAEKHMKKSCIYKQFCIPLCYKIKGERAGCGSRERAGKKAPESLRFARKIKDLPHQSRLGNSSNHYEIPR